MAGEQQRVIDEPEEEEERLTSQEPPGANEGGNSLGQPLSDRRLIGVTGRVVMYQEELWTMQVAQPTPEGRNRL